MVNGIVNVYKEKGFTSFDVVAKLRGIFHQKKIGHTGTLDPDAEGVLPVCLGKATKVCDLLTDKDKEYRAVLLLGMETDTQDISGEVLHRAEVNLSEQEVCNVIMSYVGTYEQVPPMYSALKVNGQKLCDLARKGITVERKSRPVTIHKIEIVRMELPEVEFVVSCSKGTYIRTLCDDIGKNLGCFGCMKSLLRTKVDRFVVKEAYTLQELQQLCTKPQEEWTFLYSVDSVFETYPAVTAVAEAHKQVVNGNSVPKDLLEDFAPEKQAERVRLYDNDGKFIGIYTYQEPYGVYKPIKIFMD